MCEMCNTQQAARDKLARELGAAEARLDMMRALVREAYIAGYVDGSEHNEGNARESAEILWGSGFSHAGRIASEMARVAGVAK